MSGAGEENVEKGTALGGNQDDEDKAYLVDWASNEPQNPHNWSTPYRAFLTFQLGMLALAASSASAIIAPANSTIAKYLGVGQEVVTLNISLYV